MGSQTISYPLYGGGNLLVEIDGPADASSSASDRPAIRENLDSIIAQVKPGVGAFARALRELADPPSQISMEFGVKLTGDGKAMVAKSSDGGQFKVALIWNNSGQ
jgi:hypothetical protein